MSAWEHFFKIRVEDVGESVFEVESVLCDEFPTMREGWMKHMGMECHDYKGVGPKRGTTDLTGQFIHAFDPSKESLEAVILEIKKLIWRSAGRYIEVTMQGFIIEDNQWVHSDEDEYKKLEAEGEFDLDMFDDDEDEDE